MTLLSPLFRIAALRRAKDRFLSHVNWTVTVRGHGPRFRVPIQGGLGRLNRDVLTEEGWMLPLIAAGLKRRAGLFVDVGVNVGQTLLKVKAVDRRQPYLGFEPDAAAVAYVRRLIRLNDLPDCRIVPAGLSDRPGLLALRTRQQGSAYATLVAGFRAADFYDDQVTAAVWDGDSALASLDVGRVSMVKIDVEGAELEVIRGLKGTLARDRPAILCEILPDGLDGADPRTQLRRGRRSVLLEIFLKDLGYTMQRVLADGSQVPLDTIEPHADLGMCQYLFEGGG